MKKVGFVIPWYGDTIPGGAEADMRGLAKNMVKRGYEVEILSTCVKEFSANWSENYHKPGLTEEGGLKVRRFSVDKTNLATFGVVNRKLMMGQHILSAKDLYDYIREHKDEYAAFAFIPYMFGTTYHGVQECPEKAVLIPCFHDEAYTYMKCFRRVYSKVAGMAFHAKPEYELAKKLYHLDNVKCLVVGGGMDVDLTYDANRFREKYKIKSPFILYAGRKDVGKNIYTLIDYFREFKLRNPGDLKLVMLGGGDVTIPADMKHEILDFGFVPVQDKYDAYAAAELLCQPSKNESFSIVIMESWLCERPVIVCEDCAVTKNFAIESQGGLYFKDYFDFEGALRYIMEHPDAAEQMAQNGKNYVLNHFSWDVVVEKYCRMFEEIERETSNPTE